MRSILLFPPNWTACTSGPHLALPLLAGTSRGTDWQVETWDLTGEFYGVHAGLPVRRALIDASHAGDFARLDNLYFDWEDKIRGFPWTGDDRQGFRLLSGFPLTRFHALPLSEVARTVCEGTVFTNFFADHVIPRLLGAEPSVIGVTIASCEQMVPAIELLQLIRQVLPNTYIVLGGNIVTRLRQTSAFVTLRALADQVVLFQGDLAFSRVLDVVDQIGIRKARQLLPRIASDESIPYELWPVPEYSGIDFGHYAAIPVLSYVSTRGCYWGRCHFCAIPAGWSTKGYAGSASGDFVAGQLAQMTSETGIPRVKFVDEAVPPHKIRPLSVRLQELELNIEWEGYARLESAWENVALLEDAYAGGLRKLYFGLEQAPTASRVNFGKNDHGDPLRIMRACARVGIKVHVFCMVGHPGTSCEDASATVRFLQDNEHLVDTADLVGFRLDRGTQVPGVSPRTIAATDWQISLPYESSCPGVLGPEEVSQLEYECQEKLWESVPRLLHPLYRMVGPWKSAHVRNAVRRDKVSEYT